ncbi:Alpha/Beta hydrolase protein [Mycena floridula]|nr:Alpha/Beta hydrolase protein [Mycena floridula]
MFPAGTSLDSATLLIIQYCTDSTFIDNAPAGPSNPLKRTRSLGLDFDEKNIQEGPRVRRRSKRAEVCRLRMVAQFGTLTFSSPCFSQTTNASRKFSPFNVSTATYKVIHDHEIRADILIPKSLSPSLCPLIVQIHGGAYIRGSRLFADWFPSWVLEYALANSATIVSADYRLLPEGNGKDIFEDIGDLFVWLTDNDGFPRFLPSGFSVDLTKILLAGQSAGGHIAIRAAMSQPSVRGVIVSYPSLMFPASKFIEKVKRADRSMVDEYLENMAPNAVVSAVDPPARLDLSRAIHGGGRFVELFGNDPELFPWDMLERVSSITPLFILHGTEDALVPVKHSLDFVERAKELHPEAKIHLVTVPGEHAFDAELKMETPWLKEGLDFIAAEWLKSDR